MKTKQSILVVDDEPIVAKSCRRVLSDAGYDVTTMESGLEGMSCALSEDFDLVITDLKMPDLDGMELIRRLRAEKPGTNVVVITGYGTIPSAVEATKLGVSDYIEKPFTPEQLTDSAVSALPEEQEQSDPAIEAALVREVLRRAHEDSDFGASLLINGSRVLSGYALSSETKAAVVSGDIAWIEKEYGELSAEERDWLERRLGAEIW